MAAAPASPQPAPPAARGPNESERAWRILAGFGWIGLAATVGPGLQQALRHSAAPLSIGGEVLFWAVYAAGTFAIFLPRPWGLVALRLGGLQLLGAAVAVAFAPGVDTAWRVLAPLAGAAAFGLQWSAAVGDRQADGASYPGERRFLLRWPREAAGGVAVAAFVPTLGLAALVVALGSSGGLRFGAAALAVVLAVPGWVLVRQLAVLGRRVVVLMPRAVVAMDPYLLGEPISMPLNRLIGCGLGRTPEGLLDLRAGAGTSDGEWFAFVTNAPFDCPEPRLPRLAARVAAVAHGVAVAPTRLPALTTAIEARGLRVGSPADT